MQQHVTHVAPGEGRAVHMSGDTYTFKAVGETTEGTLTLFEGHIPPGGGPPPHIHHRENEYFYLLEGTLEITEADRTFTAHAGTFVNLPKGTLHSFKNVGTQAARMLLLLTPAGLEGMFFTVGQAATPGSSATPPDAAEITKLLSVASEYGLEFPPPA